MEQKQLDELDESYFGEEFIDETSLDEIKVEKVESKPKKRTSTKKEKTSKITKSEDKPEVAPVVDSTKEEVNEPKTFTPVMEKETSFSNNDEKEAESNFKTLSPPKDPWEEPENEEGVGLFKEIGTWKVLTVLFAILLVFSVFSNGFVSSEDNTLTGATIISLEEAEQKALGFVNTNLLREPFTAEVVSSSEEGELYKVTLSVAGQDVDSYLTKDGALFFPQGFETSTPLNEELVAEDLELDNQETQEPVVVEETTPEIEEPSLEPPVVDPVVTQPVEETTDPVESMGVAELSLKAKRWLFTPHQLTVKKGQEVHLFINPESLDFTFSIPGLAVEQEIIGDSSIIFKATEAGTFQFSCSSCEDWRGMTGTITVE